MKPVLLTLISVLACSIACGGTPIEGGDRDDPPPITLDTPSLAPEQTGRAAQQLTESLRSLGGRRSRVMAALASPTLDQEEDALAVVFSELVASEFEVGRLAELLALACARQPAEVESIVAAAASLRALAISAFLELLAVLDIQTDLALGYVSGNQARRLLQDRFASLREPGEDDQVALLPDNLAQEPVLSIARSYSNLVEVGEAPVSFAEAVAALEPQTQLDIGDAAEVAAATLRLAVTTRLALISGASTRPPDSVFGMSALSVSYSQAVVYTVRGTETVGMLTDGQIPLVTLTTGNDGGLTANVLQSGADEQGPTLRDSAVLLSALDQMPSFSRPEAILVQRARGYGFEVVLSFVNPDHTPFRVTCLLPELGARATAALSGRRATGDLRARAGITVSPLGLLGLAREPQVLCLGTYGTLETGRLRLPPVVIPEGTESD